MRTWRWARVRSGEDATTRADAVPEGLPALRRRNAALGTVAETIRDLPARNLASGKAAFTLKALPPARITIRALLITQVSLRQVTRAIPIFRSVAPTRTGFDVRRAIFTPGLGEKKVALTSRASDIVTSHGPVPEQPAPDQPENREPRSGWAVSVTSVPGSKPYWQVEPHSIPTGSEVTTPPPLPPLVTVRS